MVAFRRNGNVNLMPVPDAGTEKATADTLLATDHTKYPLLNMMDIIDGYVKPEDIWPPLDMAIMQAAVSEARKHSTACHPIDLAV